MDLVAFPLYLVIDEEYCCCRHKDNSAAMSAGRCTHKKERENCAPSTQVQLPGFFFSNVVVLVITARRKRPKVRLPVKRGSAGLCVLIFTKQNNNELKTALDTLNWRVPLLPVSLSLYIVTLCAYRHKRGCENRERGEKISYIRVCCVCCNARRRHPAEVLYLQR